MTHRSFVRSRILTWLKWTHAAMIHADPTKESVNLQGNACLPLRPFTSLSGNIPNWPSGATLGIAKSLTKLKRNDNTSRFWLWQTIFYNEHKKHIRHESLFEIEMFLETLEAYEEWGRKPQNPAMSFRTRRPRAQHLLKPRKFKARIDTIDPIEAGLECECIESLNKHGIAIRYRKTYVEVETTRWSNQ